MHLGPVDTEMSGLLITLRSIARFPEAFSHSAISRAVIVAADVIEEGLPNKVSRSEIEGQTDIFSVLS